MTTATTTTTTQTASAVTAQLKPKIAPSIFMVGATGAGKSTQIESLLEVKDLEVIVVCYDPGSKNAHGITNAKLVPLEPIKDILKKYPADKYLLVIDSWPAYESWYVMNLPQRPQGKAWVNIVGTFRDEIHMMYDRGNLVLVGNITDTQKKVRSIDHEGKPCDVLMPRGSLVCTPALQSPPLLGQMAPVCLPISSGNDRSPRGWVQGQLGQVAYKFGYRPEGSPKAIRSLPGAAESDRVVSVFDCSLYQIFECLRK